MCTCFCGITCTPSMSDEMIFILIKGRTSHDKHWKGTITHQKKWGRTWGILPFIPKYIAEYSENSILVGVWVYTQIYIIHHCYITICIFTMRKQNTLLFVISSNAYIWKANICLCICLLEISITVNYGKYSAVTIIYFNACIWHPNIHLCICLLSLYLYS